MKGVRRNLAIFINIFYGRKYERLLQDGVVNPTNTDPILCCIPKDALFASPVRYEIVQ